MSFETPEDKVDFVAKAIELTKLLASNNYKTKSYGINKIKELFLKHSGDTIDAFQLNDYLIIWKRLLYYMWMSDKSLQVPPQENANEKLSELIHSCTSYQGKILFMDAFFLAIKDDWMLISQHCIDKFMRLIRRCLRQLLLTFVNCDWNLEYIKSFNEALYRALKSFTLTFRTCFQDIFLEELVRVCGREVPFDAFAIILDSFLNYIFEVNDFMLIKEVSQNVSKHLLSQSSGFQMLEPKVQPQHKVDKPGKSYNDLQLVKGGISEDNLNEINDDQLDPGVGNVNIEIPQIKFNSKSIAKVLNKYLTEVEYTKKCLSVITKLIKCFNGLEDGVLPYKPEDCKLNSRVSKKKKKKHLSKMVKERVKKFETVDSKIKKSGRKINFKKNLKKLYNIGDIIKIGTFLWNVSKFDNVSTLKDNINFNRSWTVSEETKINGANAKWIIDDKSPILVPDGFKVEVLEPPKKTPKKIKKKVSTSNFNFLTIDSSKKLESKSPILMFNINNGSNEKNIINQNSVFIKIDMHNAVHNNSSISPNDDDGASTSKTVNKSSLFNKICSPNIVNMGRNNNWLVFDESDSESKKFEKSNKSDEVEKHISLTSLPDKIFKSPQKTESPKIPTSEQKVLRRRTIIISNKKPDGQDEGSPKRKFEETSALKVSQKCRKTIAGDKITMLPPGEISNMALKKVQSEAFEDGFGSLRRSPRLSIKTDAAKKIVENQCCTK